MWRVEAVGLLFGCVGCWRGPLRFLIRLIGSAPCKCPHLMDAGCRKRYGLLDCKIIALSSHNLLEATRHAPFPHSWRRTEYSSSSQPEIDVDGLRRRICDEGGWLINDWVMTKGEVSLYAVIWPRSIGSTTWSGNFKYLNPCDDDNA